MERSFQAILAQLLEDKQEMKTTTSSSTSPLKNVSSPMAESLLWEIPRPKATFRRGFYAVSTPVTRPTPPKAEPLFAINKLSEDHRNLVQTLAHLGAPELLNGLSLNALKRAHRRLAKRLHPDMPSGSAIQFMELRKAYERLRKALPSYEVCNESASESASQPRAAA